VRGRGQLFITTALPSCSAQSTQLSTLRGMVNKY